jgi:repressor LexA
VSATSRRPSGEIGEHVGLKSPATVANHIEVLKNAGYIEKNPQQPRTLTVRYDAVTSVSSTPGPVRHVPLVGDVAAGTGVLAGETGAELIALPEQFAGRGESFMLQVRGDSMIEAGILPGDFVVVNQQSTAQRGEIVVAGIPGEEATIKRFYPQGSRVVLSPENAALEPMEFDAQDVTIFGRVISVLRNYEPARYSPLRLLALVADAYLVGLGVTVALVVYPAFADVGAAQWPSYHARHVRTITWAVAPAWFAEAVATVGWLATSHLSTWSILHALAAALTVVTTVVGAVPAHDALASGYRDDLGRRLRTWHWVRTFAWVATLVCASLGG